jgi:predicted Fe-Mo cluster-binding NifX family protein
VAPRFARAPGFLLVDPGTWQFEYVANSVAAAQTQGLGPGVAALIADAGAGVLLTGFVGARAARSLAEAGILVADGLGALTVREAVARFASGDIVPVSPETIAIGRADAPSEMKSRTERSR